MEVNVPKIIHCIWIGGGSLEESKKYDGLRSWIAHKGDYDIWLWTDSTRLQANLIRKCINKYREVNKRYLEAQTEQGKGSRLNGLYWSDEGEGSSHLGSWNAFLRKATRSSSLSTDIKDFIRSKMEDGAKNHKKLLSDMHEMGIQVKDLKDFPLETMSKWAYNVEMATRGINFAGASDIMRYSILTEYGGVYIDVDLLMLKDMPTFRMDRNGWCDLLAPIIPAFGGMQKVNRDTDSAFATNTGGAFLEKEPYLTNSALVSLDRGKAVSSMALSIREIYNRILPPEAGKTPQSITIQKYWYTMPTKSTLDITGPNFVRDVLLGRFININDFVVFARKRLSYALKGLDTVKDLYEKQFKKYDTTQDALMIDFLMFNRHAGIWPEGNIEYRGFWDWYATYAMLPMGLIKFDTPASRDSATSALLNMKF